MTRPYPSVDIVDLPLFGGGEPIHVPHVVHSKTSRDAADSARYKVREDMDRIEAWLRFNGPATDEQIQDALDMGGNTERPRRIALVNEKRVEDSGLTFKTRSGRNAVAWKAVGR